MTLWQRCGSDSIEQTERNGDLFDFFKEPMRSPRLHFSQWRVRETVRFIGNGTLQKYQYQGACVFCRFLVCDKIRWHMLQRVAMTPAANCDASVTGFNRT